MLNFKGIGGNHDVYTNEKGMANYVGMERRSCCGGKQYSFNLDGLVISQEIDGTVKAPDSRRAKPEE